MKLETSWLAAVGAALFLLVAPGCGEDDDVTACEGKEKGDACTDSEGLDGVCALDDTEETLECEDTANP